MGEETFIFRLSGLPLSSDRDSTTYLLLESVSFVYVDANLFSRESVLGGVHMAFSVLDWREKFFRAWWKIEIETSKIFFFFFILCSLTTASRQKVRSANRRQCLEPRSFFCVNINQVKIKTFLFAYGFTSDPRLFISFNGFKSASRLQTSMEAI